jgi:hypothetical protein
MQQLITKVIKTLDGSLTFDSQSPDIINRVPGIIYSSWGEYYFTITLEANV